jgi:hypothetical protein
MSLLCPTRLSLPAPPERTLRPTSSGNQSLRRSPPRPHRWPEARPGQPRPTPEHFFSCFDPFVGTSGRSRHYDPPHPPATIIGQQTQAACRPNGHRKRPNGVRRWPAPPASTLVAVQMTGRTMRTPVARCSSTVPRGRRALIPRHQMSPMGPRGIRPGERRPRATPRLTRRPREEPRLPQRTVPG